MMIGWHHWMLHCTVEQFKHAARSICGGYGETSVYGVHFWKAISHSANQRSHGQFYLFWRIVTSCTCIWRVTISSILIYRLSSRLSSQLSSRPFHWLSIKYLCRLLNRLSLPGGSGADSLWQCVQCWYNIEEQAIKIAICPSLDISSVSNGSG
jgi:hypothetical protein